MQLFTPPLAPPRGGGEPLLRFPPLFDGPPERLFSRAGRLGGVFLSLVMFALFWVTLANAGSGDEFRGWSWSEHIGWMSWNCVSSPSCTIDYGVKFDGSNILGYIWAPNVGWACVGSSCAGTAPDGRASWANLDEASGEAHGWGQFLGLGDHGWISLNCAEYGVCALANYRMRVTRATGEVAGWVWNGNADGSGIGWVSLNCAGVPGSCGVSNYFVTINTTERICDNNEDDDFDRATDCADSDCAGRSGGGGVCGPENPAQNNCKDNFDNERNGFIDCFEPLCRADPTLCLQSEVGLCTDGIDNDTDGVTDCTDHPDCDTEPACQRPESICDDGIDNNGNGFVDCEDPSCESACSVGRCAPSGEACLIDPHCPAGERCVLTPYSFFETKNGALLTQLGFNADRFPPPGLYNASSCLLSSAGAITNFRSDPAGACRPPPVPVPDPVPARKGGYVTLRGELDYQGLINGAYGDVVAVDRFADIPALLQGRVYYVKKSLTVDEARTFGNASGGVSGAGTIVVDGNLAIRRDLSYARGAIATLRNLASVAWFVRGKVNVDKDVREIVGAFYAEDVFDSGSGDSSLTIRGSLVAPEFIWRRNYADLTRGSEQILDDGRLMANPPPGFADRSASLPRFEPVASP